MSARKGKKVRTKYTAEFNRAKAHLLEAHKLLATSNPAAFVNLTRSQLDGFNNRLKRVRRRIKWAYLQEDAAQLRTMMNSEPTSENTAALNKIRENIQAYQRIHDRVMRDVMEKVDRKRELRAKKEAKDKENSVANDIAPCAKEAMTPITLADLDNTYCT